MEYTQLTRTQRAVILQRRIFDLETKHYMASLVPDVPADQMKQLETSHDEAVTMLTSLEADLAKTPDEVTTNESRNGVAVGDRMTNPAFQQRGI